MVAQAYSYSKSIGITYFSPKISKMRALRIKRIRCTYPGQIVSLLESLKEAGKGLISPEHFWFRVSPFNVL